MIGWIKSVCSSFPSIELEIGQNDVQINIFSSILAAKTCCITFHKKLENYPAKILPGGPRRASLGSFATQCMYMYMHFYLYVYMYVLFVKMAFVTGNSSLKSLLEGLFAQMHANLSSRVFGRNRTRDLRITRFRKCCALHH